MSRNVIFTDRVMRPIAHFSHAVRIGNVIHVGATAGTDAQRRLAGVTPGLVDVAAQTARMFDNVAVVLGLLGAGLENTVRVKTYLSDLRDLSVYRAQYEHNFGGIRPCHVVVGSAGFPLPQAAIEMDLVALADTPIERFAHGGDAARAQGRYHCTAEPSVGAVAEAFTQQAEQVFGRLRDRLAAGGLAARDVVYLHASLSDVRHAAAFRAAFDAFFAQSPPACVMVIAALPEPDWLLQLEVVAVAGGGTPIHAALPHDDCAIGSPAMLAGDELYIGAQHGIGADGRLAAGVEAQTRAAWQRIRALLDSARMSADDVLRTNNVLTDWRHYAGFNAGYGANVAEPYPPRATVLGVLATEGALVQIEALAHRGGATNATIVQAA